MGQLAEASWKLAGIARQRRREANQADEYKSILGAYGESPKGHQAALGRVRTREGANFLSQIDTASRRQKATSQKNAWDRFEATGDISHLNREGIQYSPETKKRGDLILRKNLATLEEGIATAKSGEEKAQLEQVVTKIKGQEFSFPEQYGLPKFNPRTNKSWTWQEADLELETRKAYKPEPKKVPTALEKARTKKLERETESLEDKPAKEAAKKKEKELAVRKKDLKTQIKEVSSIFDSEKKLAGYALRIGVVDENNEFDEDAVIKLLHSRVKILKKQLREAEEGDSQGISELADTGVDDELIEEAESYSQEDLEYTAEQEGISVEEVKRRLEVK